MKRSNIFLSFVLLAWSASVGAQDVRQLLQENPDRAANNMHSYEFSSYKETPAPKGYSPVYISHYGRHGSRHDVSTATCDRTLAMFLEADSLHRLTPAGKELLEQVRIMATEHVGMAGELSPRGGREHEQIASRMADRFPGVFIKGKTVSAVSSTAERCIVSMGYFMTSLKSRFPGLTVEMTTGDRYAPVIRLSSGTSAGLNAGGGPQGNRRGSGSPEREGDAGGRMRGPEQKALAGDYSAFLAKVFVNPDQIKGKEDFVRSIYKLGGLCQDLDFLRLDMFRYFTQDELLSLWEQDNDAIYDRWGNSVENGYAKAITAKPLLQDIIKKADAALADGKTAADLRFGHDMSYMALLSLLGIDADGGQRFRSGEAHGSWFAFQIVPTAANLQLIFYSARGKDTLFKVLRNEQEIHLPSLTPVSGPYYRWEDFKAKYLPGKELDLTFDKDNYIALKSTIQTGSGPVEVAYKAYMHIPYVANPADVQHQSLCIFEPVFIDEKSVDASSAPILFSNRVNGYLPVDDSQTSDVKEGREQLALAAGMVVVVPGCRGRTLKDGEGKNIGKAPAVLVDLKAAIRYLRHNKHLIPGDTEKIISVGCSAGGAVSAAIGASGNSSLFNELLGAIGAADERDDVFATGAFSPIMDLQHADMAYEWEFGTSPRRGELVDQEVSASLKEQFKVYQESLRMRGEGNFGQVTADNLGAYMAEFWLNPSATLFLNNLSEEQRNDYLKEHEWLSWDGKSTHFNFETYLRHTEQRVKGIPAFDAFDKTSPENSLFGDTWSDTRHFTDYSMQHESGSSTATTDPQLQQIVDMMNPLTYIRGRNNGCSQHWWIRHGTTESGNSRASVIYMATELAGQGKKVNAALFWDARHCQDKDPQGFIDWIVSITASRDEAIRGKLLDTSGKEVLTGCKYGDWHGTMENSLHAIQKAFDKGADLVTIGLKKTADGKIICFSDDTVDRLLNGSGNVAEMTLAQIRALSPKEYSGPSDWTVVPTLEEALDFAKGKVLLHIDLQDNIDEILEIVRRQNAQNQVVFKRKYPGEGFYYLPVFDVEHHSDCSELGNLLSLNPVGIELHWTKDDAPLLEEAFRMVRGRTRIAVNTSNGKAGSHHDPRHGESAEENWGTLVSEGASIIFTDGIKPLTRYLNK